MIRLSLFWKIFGSFLAIIVLTALLAGWLANARIVEDVEHETGATLHTQLVLLQEIFGDAFTGADDPALQERVRGLGKRIGTRITLVDATGRVLADSSKDPVGMENHGNRPEVLASRTAESGRSSRYSATLGMQMMYVARRIEREGTTRGYVRAALPLVNLERRLATVRSTVLGAVGIAVLVGLLAALVAARMMARPLVSMRDAAAAIAAGEFSRRVRTGTKDEIGQLGHAFNDMAERLEEDIATIRQDQRELRAILGGMVEGVIAVDVEERIVQINEAAGAILGVDPGEARGQAVWEALRLPQVPETLARAVKRGGVESATLRLLRDGRERTVSLHVSPLQGESGSNRGAILVLDDVTERRRLEEVRRDFVANASHELKTPVASVRGMAETVLADADMDAETRNQFLERILRQSHRLGDLVEEMLALSRLESARAAHQDTPAHDLRTSLEAALEDAATLAAERQVRVETDIAASPLTVRAEPEAIRRIVGNLLDNAIKYSPAGSAVHLAAGREDGGVFVAVRDAGPGIPAEKHDRVFERFYRVDGGRARGDGGTGLGLAIVKHLVQGLGGRIELESRPGSGSTFRVSLPACDTETDPRGT